MYKLIHKVITYNEKLNINSIQSNYLGFTIVYNNYVNGIKRNEFDKNIIPFIISGISDKLDKSNKSNIRLILSNLSFDQFNKNCTTYYDTLSYLKEIVITNNLDVEKTLFNFII